MTLTVLAALAEMESATKSERVLAWQERRLQSGATPTGPRPYGYRRERNELHIVEKEAKVIRQAAAAVLKGQPLRAIARDLEEAGVLGKNGTPISRPALRQILLAPTIAACREVEPGVYIRSSKEWKPGVYVSSNEWKPILTRKCWDAVRAVLTDPDRRSGPGSRRRWLLSGILQCGRCADGTTMVTKPHVTGPRYSCGACHLSIEVARTDEVVVGDLLALLDHKTWRALRQGRAVVTDTAEFETAMAALTERFLSGDLGGVALGRLADELRAQQEESAAPPPPLPDVADLGKAWPKLTLEQRRLVLSAATESLTIRPASRGVGFDESRIVWVSV
jgi:hypothetical protein